jgi:hypothetical protein
MMKLKYIHPRLYSLNPPSLMLNSMRKYNRVIRKVRKTQHQNPEFGHTQSEIQKKSAKMYISIQAGVKHRKPSILVGN